MVTTTPSHKKDPAKLLVTPERRSDESPLGHVARTALANACPTVGWLIQLAGGNLVDSLVSISTHHRLAPALGLDPNAHLPTRPVAGSAEEAQEIRIGSAWLEASHCDLSGSRICPVCLDESPYRRAIWDIRALRCCPEHENRLLDACPDCGAAPAIEAGSLTACRCGYDLTRAKTEPADDTELALARWIAHLAGFGPEPGDAAMSSLSPYLRALSLSDLIDLVVMLGHELFGADAVLGRRQVSAEAWGGAMDAGVAALECWPEGLSDGLRFDRDRGRPAALSFRKRHRGIYTAFADRFSGDRFAFLREAVEKIEHDKWEEYQQRFSCRLPEEIAFQEEMLVGVASLAGELGVEERIAMQLVAGRAIPAVTRGTRNDVEDWLVEPDAARRLLSRMEASIREIPTDGCAFGLHFRFARSMCTRFGNWLSWLINNTVNGNLPLIARADTGKGLYDFIYDYDRLADRILDRHSLRSEPVRTHHQAVILGLPGSRGEWLVNNIGLERTDRGDVPVEEMRYFCRLFTVPTYVFFGQNTGLKNGKAGLEALGVEPFASRETGAPTTFYWRQDIEDKLATYMRRRKNRAEESAA